MITYVVGAMRAKVWRIGQKWTESFKSVPLELGVEDNCLSLTYCDEKMAGLYLSIDSVYTCSNHFCFLYTFCICQFPSLVSIRICRRLSAFTNVGGSPLVMTND